MTKFARKVLFSLLNLMYPSVPALLCQGWGLSGDGRPGVLFPKSLFKIWRNARQAQIFSLDKAIWRRNTLCISSQINAGQRKKMCRDGVLIDFKQALKLHESAGSKSKRTGGEGEVPRYADTASFSMGVPCSYRFT